MRRWFLAYLATCSLWTAPAHAGPEVSKPELSAALLDVVTLHRTRSGRPVFVRHCKRSPASCARRIELLSSLIFDSAIAHHLPVDVFAAMAVHESGLDPFAVGGVGEKGIYQLHPKGPGRGIQFVTDERYWRKCMAQAGACQEDLVERAAVEFSRGLKVCGGVKEALGYYNTGKCDAQSTYAKRVLYTSSKLSLGLRCLAEAASSAW